jgi:hypothetical protein
MITSQVFQSITTGDLVRVADACGFPTEIDESGGKRRVWLTVAGRVTLASIFGPDSAPNTIVLLTGVMSEIRTSPERANAYNVSKANWCTVYCSDDHRPVVTMPIDIEGVTRQHLAGKLFIWEYCMNEFQGFFR